MTAGAALGFLSLYTGAPWWLRAIVFAPLYVGGVGLLYEKPGGARRALWMSLGLTVLLMLAPNLGV